MENSPLPSSPPALVERASASAVRPETPEQALDMLKLIMAELTAVIIAADADLASRLPLDDQEPERTAGESRLAKEHLGRLTRDYAERYGNLNIPLISLGGNHAALRAALPLILGKIAEGTPTKPACT